ncbi:hypothetical protein F7725_009470 [Dissostichus mawsoni]|uniref:PiggyBac transposable element-derived protein domain-containing protein n=1 Tax=Dissostichus mawsoni TaxID=36200 RepID=A0A7J5XKU3_DISMA|nr:hypothetical protein F7725_009470 [Dissostichus mawsoni]
MSSKRFRLLKRVVHFNDNTELPGSIDRFFKVRPLLSFLNSAFRRTARDNRIGKPPLKSIKEMEKKAVSRGTCDYIMSDDGILAVRWKDNRTVSLLSTDMGVEPM